MVDKLSEDNSMVGANEARNKINEIIDDASGDFSAAAVTVADEGGDLSTAATKLDFVGAGVAASGTGATKTITISGGSIGPVAGAGAYSTGWTQDFGGDVVENMSNHLITHNLGTSDILVEVYVNTSASDSGAQQVAQQHATADGGTTWGYTVQGISSTTMTLGLGRNGYYKPNASGLVYQDDFGTSSIINVNTRWVKVIIASGGGGITVAEEGSDLTTPATKLDFVGSSVTASGTGTTKTITVSGGGLNAGGTGANSNIYFWRITNLRSASMHTAFTTANVDQGTFFPTIWITDYQGNPYVPPSGWLNTGAVSGVPRSLVYCSEAVGWGAAGPLGYNSTTLGEDIRLTSTLTTFYWTTTTIETYHSMSTNYTAAGWIIP